MKRLSARPVLLVLVVSLFFVVPGGAVVNTEGAIECGGATPCCSHDASGVRLGFYYYSTNFQGGALSTLRPILFTSSDTFLPQEMPLLFTTSATPQHYANPPVTMRGGVDSGYDCDFVFRSGTYLYGRVTGVTMDLWATGTKGGLFSLSYDPPHAYAASGVFRLYDYWGDYDVLTDLMLRDAAGDYGQTFADRLVSWLESTDSYAHIRLTDANPASREKSYSVRGGEGVFYLGIAGGLDSRNAHWNDEYELGVTVTGDYVASPHLLSYDGVRSTVGTSRLEGSRVLCSIVGEHILEEGFVGGTSEIKCCGARSSDVGEINANYVCAKDGVDRYQWVDLCGLPATPPAEYGFSASDLSAINAAKASPGTCCVEASDSGGYCAGTMKLRCDSADTYFCPGLDGYECADSRVNCEFTPGGCYTTGSCISYYTQVSGPARGGALVPSFTDGVAVVEFIEPPLVGDDCACSGLSESSCNSKSGCTWSDEDCTAGTAGNYPSCVSTWDPDFCRGIGCTVEDYNNVPRSAYGDECSRLYSKDDCLVTPDCYWKCKGEIGDPCDQNKDCLSGLCRADFYGEKRCQSASTADRCVVGPYAGTYRSGSSWISFSASTTRTLADNTYVCIDEQLRQCDTPTVPYDSDVCSSTIGFVCTGTPDSQVCSGYVTCSERSPSCNSEGCTMTAEGCYDTSICDTGSMVDGPSYAVPEGALAVVGSSDDGTISEASFKEILPDGMTSDCGCEGLPESLCSSDPDCGWTSSYCTGSSIACSTYYSNNVAQCRTSLWCEVTPPDGFTSCTGTAADDDGDGTVEYYECDVNYGCDRSCYVGAFSDVIEPDTSQLACQCAGDSWVSCYRDADGDGFAANVIDGSRCIPSGEQNFAVGGVICNYNKLFDCADDDPARYPGNTEVCDNKDNDCSNATVVDLGCDDDNDEYVDITMSCTPGRPFRSADGTTNMNCDSGQINDCDDDDPLVFPGQTEFCNGGKNDDCNDATDDEYCVSGWCNAGVCEAFTECFRDKDGDGFGNASASVANTGTCPSGYVLDNRDCDDIAYCGCTGASCTSPSPIPGVDMEEFCRTQGSDDAIDCASIAMGFPECGPWLTPGSSVNPDADDLCDGDTMDDCSIATPDGSDDCGSSGVCVGGAWSGWVDRDDPSGAGDYESLAGHYSDGSVSCDDALHVECRTTAGVDYVAAGEVVSCLPHTFACANANQPDGSCLDYEVRFACPDGSASCVSTSACYPDGDGDGYGDAMVTVPVSRPGGCGPGEAANNDDCNDGDDAVYPDAPEMCDGVINDCGRLGAKDGADACDFASEYCDGVACRPTLRCFVDADHDGHGVGSGARVNASSCPAGAVSGVGDDCDDADNQRFPGNPEVCNNKDSDCDYVVDEGTGSCYSDPPCLGSLDCHAEFMDDGFYYGSCEVDLGCTEVPGRCSTTGFACDTDHPCSSGLCLGLDCVGFPSCQGFGDADCGANAGYGCSLPGCGAGDYARTEIGSQGAYTCSEVPYDCEWACGGTGEVYEEICSNNIDDDGDTFVDCMDPDCQVPAGGTTDVPRLVCLGTDRYNSSANLTAIAGTQWQCDQGVDSGDNEVVGVGLCCQEGEFPRVNAFGLWICGSSQYCLAPTGDCAVVYSGPTFDTWRADPDCLDSSTPLACCNVVQFGVYQYWSDEGNVVIY